MTVVPKEWGSSSLSLARVSMLFCALQRVDLTVCPHCGDLRRRGCCPKKAFTALYLYTGVASQTALRAPASSLLLLPKSYTRD